MGGERSIGLVQVYTGCGKGKTTAALGLVMRAAGRGYSTIVIQFMKGGRNYGEVETIKAIENAEIEQYGRPDFVDRNNPAQVDIDLAEQALKRAREVVMSGKYDLVVLDEINVAQDYGLIKLDDVLSLIKDKPEHVELVLTGRGAHPEIINAADLVTVMAEVKHPHRRGIEARDGIEY